MGRILTENSIKVFGASLDALDTREAVSIKRSYIEALSSRRCCRPDQEIRMPCFETL